MSATLAGWFGTPLPGWFGSWWTVAGIGVLIAIGAVFLFRSLRRWKQAPPGRDPSAQQAEMHLTSESRLTDRW